MCSVYFLPQKINRWNQYAYFWKYEVKKNTIKQNHNQMSLAYPNKKINNNSETKILKNIYVHKTKQKFWKR
jgi:hypothetical protein